MSVGLLHCDSLIAVHDVLLAVNPSAVGKLDIPVMVNPSKSECQTAEKKL